MKALQRLAFSALFAPLLAPALGAQTLPTASNLPGIPPVPTSLEDRRQALAKVGHDYWEDLFKHNPELASVLGDTRFNDQLTNYTSGSYNEQLGREQAYLMQIAVIDLAGFTEDERQQHQALAHRFEEDQKTADSKPWQTPISSESRFYAVYPQLAQLISFTTDKDYDDWTARLHLLPEAVAQAMQDMSLGIDEGHVPTREVASKALAEVSALAHQKAEDSPFSFPLKKFPADLSPTKQERIRQNLLEAVTKDALTSYLRLERFLSVSYIPASAKGSEVATTREAQLLAAALELRAKAQQALGEKFDLKAFQDEFLKAGLLPADQLRQQVEAWIASAGK